MYSKKKKIAAIVLIFIFGTMVGWYLNNLISHRDVSVNEKNKNLTMKEMGVYNELASLEDFLRNEYYFKLSSKKMRIALLKALVASSEDPYSIYMTAEEYDGYKAQILGNFEGIGIVYAQKERDFIVISTYKNSPARRAGIKPGYKILSVDGKKYTNKDAIGVAIRGASGTKVTMKLLSRKGRIKTLTMKRQPIVNESVTSKSLGKKIWYIRIQNFEENTAEDFVNALSEGENKGKTKLVLDLRNNGGGLVVSGMKIADQLIGRGIITSIKDKKGTKKKFKSDSYRTSMKYVVLINDHSASTTEILASAIKDNEAGRIVGTRSFGKGIIQGEKILANGDVIHYTSSEYISPKGNKIHKIGVKPDYIVKSPSAQLNKAIELLR